jgi:hypothetical protein
MWSEAKVAAALKHSKELLTDDGFIFIADRVKADPESPNGLNWGKKWNEDWIYSGVVIDPSEGGMPQDIFRWRTPRCTELKFLRHRRN